MMVTSNLIERECAGCHLSYRYPAGDFVCQGCGLENEIASVDRREIVRLKSHFDDRGLLTRPKDKSGSIREISTRGKPLRDAIVAAGGEIPLKAVAAVMNSMSSDGLRQLHDRLAILNMVHEANRWRSTETEHHDLVRRLLSGVGVQS